MFNLAIATTRRLMGDLKVFIPLIIVPVTLLLIVAALSLNGSGPSKQKLAIMGSLDQKYQANLAREFSLTLAKDRTELEAMVVKGSVIGGLTDDLRVVVSDANLEFNSFVAASISQALYHPKELEVQDPLQKAKQRQGLVDQVTNFMINYMMFSLMMVGSEMLSLKGNGVLRRITAMPLSKLEIVAGHLMAFTLMLGIQILIVHLGVYLLFGLSMVNNLAIGMAAMLAMVVVILSLGILLTRITDNQSMLPLFANLLMIPLMMLSGTFMNLSLGKVFDGVRYITPQYWVRQAYTAVNSGASMTSALLPIAALLAMGLVLFSAATIGNKRLFQE